MWQKIIYLCHLAMMARASLVHCCQTTGLLTLLQAVRSMIIWWGLAACSCGDMTHFDVAYWCVPPQRAPRCCLAHLIMTTCMSTLCWLVNSLVS